MIELDLVFNNIATFILSKLHEELQTMVGLNQKDGLAASTSFLYTL